MQVKRGGLYRGPSRRSDRPSRSPPPGPASGATLAP